MRRLYAAALIAISSWGWISPPQAFAQLLPPLPGSLVVTITSPAADTTVGGTITVTVNVQDTEFVCETAVHVTIVVPSEKSAPEGGVQVTVAPGIAGGAA